MALEFAARGNDGVTRSYHRILRWTSNAEELLLAVTVGSYLDKEARQEGLQSLPQLLNVEWSPELADGGRPALYEALKSAEFAGAKDV